jgi:hypothetical protein
MRVTAPPQSKHLLGMSYDILKIDRKLDAIQDMVLRLKDAQGVN